MALEIDLIPIICSMLFGGSPETTVPYSVNQNLHYVRVDCVTENEVIEVGLDKRSSLDSVQQALFASALTGKKPVVVIVDTDGTFDQYEYRIKTAAGLAGVGYKQYSLDFLIRTQMTEYFRKRPPAIVLGKFTPEGS